MPRNRQIRAIESGLRAKGLESYENHHQMWHKSIDGVTHIVTRISHRRGEVSDKEARLMARQCVLQLREFWRLIDCSLSEEQWHDLVKQRVVDGRNPFVTIQQVPAA